MRGVILMSILFSICACTKPNDTAFSNRKVSAEEKLFLAFMEKNALKDYWRGDPTVFCWVMNQVTLDGTSIKITSSRTEPWGMTYLIHPEPSTYATFMEFNQDEDDARFFAIGARESDIELCKENGVDVIPVLAARHYTLIKLIITKGHEVFTWNNCSVAIYNNASKPNTLWPLSEPKVIRISL
ncbi:MAG: hypothetical protein V4665_00750 [Patescibacteria group bacterium]